MIQSILADAVCECGQTKSSAQGLCENPVWFNHGCARNRKEKKRQRRWLLLDIIKTPKRHAESDIELGPLKYCTYKGWFLSSLREEKG